MARKASNHAKKSASKSSTKKSVKSPAKTAAQSPAPEGFRNVNDPTTLPSRIPSVLFKTFTAPHPVRLSVSKSKDGILLSAKGRIGKKDGKAPVMLFPDPSKATAAAITNYAGKWNARVDVGYNGPADAKRAATNAESAAICNLSEVVKGRVFVPA